MEIEKNIEISMLLEIYGNLLTQKQFTLLNDYYNNDLSLAEIAENNSVSRNAVHGQIRIVEEKLEFYEKTLELYQKGIKIKELIQDIDTDIKSKIEELI